MNKTRPLDKYKFFHFLNNEYNLAYGLDPENLELKVIISNNEYCVIGKVLVWKD